MDGVVLPPELEQFAIEAVAAGRYRDMAEVVGAGVDLLRQRDAARAELLASVLAAQEEADRDGCVSLNAVELEMRAVIRAAARQSA